MTQIANLPQLSGSFLTATNSDWRYTIAFVQPAPNQASPLDLTGIVFRGMLRLAADAPPVVLALSTVDGTLVNGGTAGTLSIAVPARAMALVPPGTYVVDLIAIADGEQINLFLAAPATVTHVRGVTR